MIKRCHLLVTLVVCGLLQIPSQAQVRQSPTPITVDLITPTPFSAQQAIATVTPTFTATPRGPVLLEALETAGNVNIRAEPDPNSERLGNISFGTQYPVLRQYFSWYELQYDLSPTGRAWVYGELVEIVGDVAEIEVVDTLEIEPTQAPEDLQATETWLAITSAPGGAQTATANARVLSVPTVSEQTSIENVAEVTVLPTYTYPPDIVAVAPTPMNITSDGSENPETPIGQTPPLLPIILLGGFGIVGLLFNSLRS